MLAVQRAVSAGERETGHPDRLDGAGHGRQPVPAGGRDDIARGRATLSDRDARVRVDGDAAHRAQVEHQSAVVEGAAGPVVPSAAHRQRQIVLARRGHSPQDVVLSSAPRDHRGPPVHGAVPDLPCLVV